jgi:ABC-type molybdate transport system ATPase subunit
VEAGHENIRVFIDPAQIDIAVDDNSGESIPNTFQGRVVQLMAENEHIRVVIDAGILITLLLGKSRYRQTHPLVGDVLSLTIPSDTIKFL